MKTGVFGGIPNEEYHGGPGISKSGLDLIAKSPLHYWAAYLDPMREPREETAAMRVGTAIHTAILEPDTFLDRYRIMPEGIDRRTKKGKEEYETLIAEAAAMGATLLSADDAKTALQVAKACHAHPLAAQLLGAGAAEQSVYWVDDETGILCKCRPDWLLEANPNHAILDVKSTEDASPEGFMKSAYKYRYHVQAAWYLDGVEQATGMKADSFMFLALEKKRPYAAAFYFADEAMIEAGRVEYREALRTYADCLAADKWPGYADRLVPLSLPRWAQFTDSEEIEVAYV